MISKKIVIGSVVGGAVVLSGAVAAVALQGASNEQNASVTSPSPLPAPHVRVLPHNISGPEEIQSSNKGIESAASKEVAPADTESEAPQTVGGEIVKQEVSEFEGDGKPVDTPLFHRVQAGPPIPIPKNQNVLQDDRMHKVNS